MGLDDTGIHFLSFARSQEIDFSITAMIGRQIIERSKSFAEPYLRSLGAGAIESFDVSREEHPTYVHDFNRPIPAEFENRYSVVLDGGTLEHIFNWPQAIANCMKMLKIGGHFLGISPMNDSAGHGFYQLSPAVFFRTFTEDNGFALRHCFFTGWTPCRDQELAGAYNSRGMIYLYVIAQKTADAVIFGRGFPQQHDIWPRR
jgi:hypothetical protein